MAVPTQKITTMIAPIVMTATCTDDEIACLGHPQVNGTDVQVLTIVLSNAKLDDVWSGHYTSTVFVNVGS
jgi:hypothetical protein